ncbi:hypothetical protein [Pelagerythrobacter sp.]|uniref:hypothetical protein n=1 Tax=Pelagerythrobacter sp. TaxID=2800702 RepID=UPI0035B22D01
MRIAIAVLALMLAACDADQTESEPSGPVETVDLAAARAEAEAMIEAVALPTGAPAPPVVASCTTEQCEVTRTTFMRRDWPAAWRGDYQGQRNVAFCLSNGCEGAVAVDQTTGCAWRSVILETQVAEADDTDAANIEVECQDLSPVQVRLATKKAEQIVEAIENFRQAA